MKYHLLLALLLSIGRSEDASDPDPPPPPLPRLGKMSVKWEPFRNIFENIIRPIGGEEAEEMALMEEDIAQLEDILLVKAKEEPQFVEAIISHLISIRERYIQLRRDWQKTIDERNGTGKAFKARIVDREETVAPPSNGLPFFSGPLEITQSFVPDGGQVTDQPFTEFTESEETSESTEQPTDPPTPVPTPPPPPPPPPSTSPPQIGRNPPSPPTIPADFFSIPSASSVNRIRPDFNPLQNVQTPVIFDTAVPQFVSRGSPPSPPPHIRQRLATATPRLNRMVDQTPPIRVEQREHRLPIDIPRSPQPPPQVSTTPPSTTAPTTIPWWVTATGPTTREPTTVPWWVTAIPPDWATSSPPSTTTLRPPTTVPWWVTATGPTTTTQRPTTQAWTTRVVRASTAAPPTVPRPLPTLPPPSHPPPLPRPSPPLSPLRLTSQPQSLPRATRSQNPTRQTVKLGGIHFDRGTNRTVYRYFWRQGESGEENGDGRFIEMMMAGGMEGMIEPALREPPRVQSLNAQSAPSPTRNDPLSSLNRLGQQRMSVLSRFTPPPQQLEPFPQSTPSFPLFSPTPPSPSPTPRPSRIFNSRQPPVFIPRSTVPPTVSPTVLPFHPPPQFPHSNTPPPEFREVMEEVFPTENMQTRPPPPSPVPIATPPTEFIDRSRINTDLLGSRESSRNSEPVISLLDTPPPPPSSLPPVPSQPPPSPTPSLPPQQTSDHFSGEFVAPAQRGSDTVEDISDREEALTEDEAREASIDESQLAGILQKQVPLGGPQEAKWFSGGDGDKGREGSIGSPKRFISEFPSEVDPLSFVEEDPEALPWSSPSLESTPLLHSTTPPSLPPSPPSFSPPPRPSPPPVSQVTLDEFVGEFIDGKLESIEVDESLSFPSVIATQSPDTPPPPMIPPDDRPFPPSTPPPSSTLFPPSDPPTIPPRPRMRNVHLRAGLETRRPSVIVWGRKPPPRRESVEDKGSEEEKKEPAEVEILEEWSRMRNSHGKGGRWTPTTTPSTHALEDELEKEAHDEFFEELAITNPPGRTTMRTEEGRGRRRMRGRDALRGRTPTMKRLNTSELSLRPLHKDAPQPLPLSPRSSRHILPSPSDEASIQQLVFDLRREETSRKSDETFASCQSVYCDFEGGDLCLYSTSLDELVFGDDNFRYTTRRRKRFTDSVPSVFVLRAWSNWGGAKGNPMTGNIAVATGRGSSDVFEQSANERFGGVQVNDGQMAMLSTQVNAREEFTILFDAWEGTRGVQLRVCCDSHCPFETDIGVKKGQRNWLQYAVTCPKNTVQVSFECLNTGQSRGACGVDNIRMETC